MTKEIELNITTAADAIVVSAGCNETIYVCLPIEEADKLGLKAEGCAEQFFEPRLTEYWGTTECGKTWRVCDYAE